MSRPARSILVFGLYIVVLGFVLAIQPNLVIGLFGFPVAEEPWIQVLGVVVMVLGGYYLLAARQENIPFFRWTIWGRTAILVGFSLLVVAGAIQPALILFGLIDAAGAVWTALELRRAEVKI